MNERDETARVREAAAFLTERLSEARPLTAIVLGSGLGDLAGDVADPVTIAYAEIPGFPQPTVAGHSGKLLAGSLGGKPVIMQSGRFHFYEGHPAESVVLPVRVFATLGVRNFVVTNAAGGIRHTMTPPALMLINDHINLMGRHPLRGAVVDGEPRFPDMSQPYDPEFRRIARQVALANGIRLDEGVYAGLLGPSYETPAEIRMLERIGADAVGMSTVPEVIVATARGLRVLGISSITNPAAGTSTEPLNHEEVLAAGRELARDLGRLITGVVQQVG